MRPQRTGGNAKPPTARRYTDEQKAEALALYAEHGAAEAARRTGITGHSIRSWARRKGITSQVIHANARATRAAVVRRQRNAEERKVALVAKLGELAELGLDTTLAAIDIAKPGDLDLRAVIGAWTRAIHDLQLLSGGATARTETRDLASAEDVLRLRDELAERRAKKASA